MSVDYYNQLISRNETLLSRWRGANAQLRELTVSHTTLRIVLTEEGRDGNLVIACIDPKTIRAPISWQNSRLRIETTRMDGGDIGIVVLDDDAAVAVTAGTFEIAENVKRW